MSSASADKRCSGFTLVELLVVIAIIAILVSLLLPAVNSAREAARRTQCTNNLRQLALANHNYVSAQRTFPDGAARSAGGNWALFILPFIEEGGIYDQLEFGEYAGSPDDGSYWSDGNAPDGPGLNYELLHNIVVSPFRCPSNTWPALHTKYESQNLGDWEFPYKFAVNDYVGIAGFANIGPTYKRVSGEGWYGVGAANGIFYSSSDTGPQHIVDGTTHTLLLGEQSGIVMDNGQPFDLRSGAWAGGWYGAWGDQGKGHMCGDPPSKKVPWRGNHRCYWTGIVTMRYAIGVNARAASGALDCWDLNQPLNSNHPGGVLVARADGGANFMRNGTGPDILRPLSIRDDREYVAPID